MMNNVLYKILIGLFALTALVLGGAYVYQRYEYNSIRRDLNNKIANLEVMQKETETAYSKLAVENGDLQTSSKELQNILQDRDEQILALTQANLKLKNQKIKIEDAKQIVVEQDGKTPVTKEEEKVCEQRIRVEFEKEQEMIKVKGFTLTNPPYSELTLEFTRELKLELVLTKSEDGTYRVYVDSKNSDAVPTELKLQVDPEILAYKWYQNISFGSTVNFGETGILFSLSAAYDFMPNLLVGPNIIVEYNGSKAIIYYGAIIVWHPFR